MRVDDEMEEFALRAIVGVVCIIVVLIFWLCQ